MFQRLLRRLFFLTVVHPVVLIVLGINIRRREKLPQEGPAVIVANHNSHLDALVLMTLFGIRQLPNVRPVAAADYFLKSRFSAWLSRDVIGIIPLERTPKSSQGDPLAPVCEALDQKQVVILFPEGTRGEPEKLERFRTGIAHLAKRYPALPFVPVFMHGLGKALPRGEGLLVPFFCDIFVDDAVCWTGDKTSFMALVEERMTALANECPRPEWD